MPTTKPTEKLEACRLATETALTGPQIAARLGVSRTSVYRWLNPERDRAYATSAASASTCPRCSGGKSRHAAMCADCRHNRARREEILRRARDGQASFTIALAVGGSPESVKAFIRNMRRRGHLV